MRRELLRQCFPRWRLPQPAALVHSAVNRFRHSRCQTRSYAHWVPAAMHFSVRCAFAGNGVIGVPYPEAIDFEMSRPCVCHSPTMMAGCPRTNGESLPWYPTSDMARHPIRTCMSWGRRAGIAVSRVDAGPPQILIPTVCAWHRQSRPRDFSAPFCMVGATITGRKVSSLTLAARIQDDAHSEYM